MKKIIVSIIPLLIFVLAGHALAQSKVVVDSTQQLAYVEGGDKLYLIDGMGKKPALLVQMGEGIKSPSWSPDGKRIAFLTLSRRLLLPGQKEKGKLVLCDVESKNHQEISAHSWQTIASGPNQGRVVLIPPIWTSDGKYLYITDQKGVQRVDLTGGRVQIVRREKLKATTLSLDGLQLAYTDGKVVFLANSAGADEINLAPKSPSFAKLTKRDVRKLAFAPDGSQLAIAENKHLFLLSVETMNATQIHQAKDAIYWLAWLPGGSHLLYLAGLPGMRGLTRSVANPAGTADGHYKLFSVSAQGTELIEIVSRKNLDVNDVCPSLSGDGQHVAFISNPARWGDKVLIATTNSAGSMQLTQDGWCSYPTWRPRPAQDSISQ